MPGWRLRGSYSYLEMKLHLAPDSTDTTSDGPGRAKPAHQVILQSAADLTRDIDFDVSLKYSSSLTNFTIADSAGLPAQWTADVRVAYHGWRGVELSLVGQNLFFGSHIQFKPDIIPWEPTRVGPTAYAKAVVHF